jgi:1-acyl-sn-glycerol-3-phosphate acyltransferase
MNPVYRFGWLLSRLISKLIFRVKVRGQKNIPATGGYILASNHASYLDPPFVGCWSSRSVYFLAKKELFDNWLLRQVMRKINAFPVKRGHMDRQALQTMARVIGDGNGLVVFPEGTRSRTDDFLRPKPGVGMMAIQARCPVVPAYVHGSNRLRDCFWGRCNFSITYGPPISADWIASNEADKEGYRAVSQEIMSRIEGLKRDIVSSD